MKCREGCENERSSLQVVCKPCWARVPIELRFTCLFVTDLDDAAKLEGKIRDWLAADDKRRAE
jgi:hypothetical protein